MGTKKAIFVVVLIIVAFFVGVFASSVVRADELDDITKQLATLSRDLQDKEANQQALARQLSDIRARVSFVESEIPKREREIADEEKQLAHLKDRLDDRIVSYYKSISKNFVSIINFLVATNLDNSLRVFFYQQTVISEDRRNITNTVRRILALDEKKKALVGEKQRLASANAEIDRQSKIIGTQILDTKKKIGELNEKQKSIVSARSGTAITSVGSVPTGSDANASIAFKSSAPSGSFAAFSFGAYTHRNGMSQYGAKKQAESKSYQEIIQWYYGVGVKKDDGAPTTIDVQGEGTMEMQKYLYGIAEMPSSWPINALKAQAVAARTYAIRASKPICTNQNCQVFLKSKSDNPPAEWKQAVDETDKEVLDGSVSSQYSSTTGGYLNTSGWDTTDRSNGGDWTSRAWESMAGSPWFYRGWYRDGYSDGGNSCGRAHPWLSQEEMSDIINAWIVRKNPNGADTNRIIPITISQCPIGGVSGNPYPMSELRDKGGVSSISSVSTSNNNSGQTTNVSFQTNKGPIDIPGSEFKETFNLRAPGYISIPQAGFAFFNIEKN